MNTVLGTVFGVLWLAAFLACGVWCALKLHSGRTAQCVWLGCVFGLAAAMWLPALAAFFTGFTLAAQLIAPALALAAAAAVTWLRRGTKLRFDRPDGTETAALIVTGVVTAVTLGLLITHNLLPTEYGYAVGQSTYGDLSLHVGIATGLAEQGTFPPDYTIFPGTRLSYPFLADSLSASLLVLGMPLQAALTLPAAVAAALLAYGFFRFAFLVTKRRGAAILATLLFFFNGGFGFAYFFDMLREQPHNLTQLFGYYTTPTNYVEHGIKWVNIICDMLVPQRTTLFGYTLLFAALPLLHAGLTEKRSGLLLAAGCLAGCIPMVNTHSYLALGLVAMGFIFTLYDGRGMGKWAKAWLCFGLPAVLLALPQLFYWTFSQARGEQFVRFSLDWANDTDNTLWFWLKNLGLVALAIPPALVHAKGTLRRTALAGFVIFVIAHLLLFQPNPYDNNKLLFIWSALMLMPVSCLFIDGYRALEGRIGGVRLIAAGMAVMLFLSAGMSLAQEYRSRHLIYSNAELEAVAFIRENTEPDDVFLTGDQHCNAVSTLAGRSIYSGTPTFLYYHGIDYTARALEVDQWYSSPSTLLGQDHVQYVYYSGWERSRWENCDFSALECVYDRDGIAIYRVPQV